MRPSYLRPFVGLLLSALPACTSGQTGGQVGTPDQHAEGGCTVLSSTPVERAAQSPLGFSPEDMLALAGGAHTAPLDWGSAEALSGWVTVTPSAGVSELTLTVIDDGEPAQYVAQEAGSPTTGGELVGTPAGSACPAFLRVPVRVEVRTENGAFADTFQAHLRSTSSDRVALAIEFELSDLEGSFHVAPSDPGLRPTQFRVTASFSEDSFSGAVEGILEQQQGESVSSTWLEFGSWTSGTDLEP